jgi:hypothetical protein
VQVVSNLYEGFYPYLDACYQYNEALASLSQKWLRRKRQKNPTLDLLEREKEESEDGYISCFFLPNATAMSAWLSGV